MKQLGIVAIVVIVVAAAAYVVLRQQAATIDQAARAEDGGNHGEALSRYVRALSNLIPATSLPDVNRTRTLDPAEWKKSMARYAGSLADGGTEVDREKRRELLDGVLRTAAKVPAVNLLSGPAVEPLSLEQYAALWNGAHFVTGVEPDTGHAPLIETCYGSALSLVKFRAPTTYTYQAALLDTVRNRRITFSVHPEDSTLILAPPGSHLLICTSTFKPAPGQIWRSKPAVIPVSVPTTPSLLSFRIETLVARQQPR